MGRSVVQNRAARLVAILTDSDGLPVLDVTTSDITLMYRKAGGSFVEKDTEETTASVTSVDQDTFNLTDGDTLTLKVDGGEEQTATFNTADFSDITAATAAEVVAVLTSDITGATASTDGDYLTITSDSTTLEASIQVTGGAANADFGFPTTVFRSTQPWTEVGGGFYEIEFEGTELDTLGNFIYKITGSLFNQYSEIVQVIASEPVVPIEAIDTCVLTGHIFGVDGRPVPNATVSARVLGTPSILDGVGVAEGRVLATTDANGEFFLELARMSLVEIFISKLNYKRQLTVPNASNAVLFEIP